MKYQLKMKSAKKDAIGKYRYGDVKSKNRVCACARVLAWVFNLDGLYSLLFSSMLIGSPDRIFPSSSTRAKTPSRGIMQSPAL